MTMTPPSEACSVTMTDILARIKPRHIEGNSAILIPFQDDGSIDDKTFVEHIERTARAGLRPCVNMDTGYVHLLSTAERLHVLEVTQQVMGGRSFIAGAFVEGQAGDPLDLYLREVETVQRFGGVPILFPSHFLKELDEERLVEVYRRIAQECEAVLMFELGTMFAPFGVIYSLEVVGQLMQIPQIIGMKHSSLSREQEWQRLELRDRIRPDFRIYTGNDLAIDMVIYGSDYLLGLSTFAPEAFARRDRWWEEGNAAFYQLNDLLQYLGFFAFRTPTPAYKHSAAQFLHARGLFPNDKTHPRSPVRPDTDMAILRDIVERLETV